MHRTATPLVVLIALATAPLAAAEESEAVREQARANFLEADVDGDRALTLPEFTTLIDLNAEDGIGRAHLIRRMGRYEMAFGRVDADADGLVTTEEIRAAAKSRR